MEHNHTRARCAHHTRGTPPLQRRESVCWHDRALSGVVAKALVGRRAVTSRRRWGCWRSGRGTRLLWRHCGPERSLMRQHEAGRACSGGQSRAAGAAGVNGAVGSNGRGGRLNRDCLARTHGGGGCWGMARGCLTGGSYCRGGCGRGGVEERNSPRLLLVRVRFCRTQLGHETRGGT